MLFSVSVCFLLVFYRVYGFLLVVYVVVERDGSVREHCTQSTRSIGQEERRDRNTDR